MQNAINVSLRSAKPKRYQSQANVFGFCAVTCVCVLELLPTRVACQISKSGRITVEVGGGRLLSSLPNVKSSNCAKLQNRVKKSYLYIIKIGINKFMNPN